MSQYPYPPNPYVPPSVDYAAWPVAPRRDRNGGIAAILQLLLGGFLFLAGSCAGVFIGTTGFDAIFAEMQKQGATLPNIPGHDVVAIFRVTMICVFVAMIAAGLLLVALAPFVYRAKKGATVASILTVGVIAVILMLGIVTGLSQAGLDPNVIAYLAGMVYCIATLVMQIQALRTAPDPRASAALQQAWYWLQQQQAASGYGYGQGAGYGYPPPPPTTSLPAPPTDPRDPPAPPSA